MKRLLPCLLLAVTLPLTAQLSLDSENREGKPILINSDAMSVDIEKGIATFYGNVIVNDPDVIITCKKMVLYQEPKEKTKAREEEERKKKEALLKDMTEEEREKFIAREKEKQAKAKEKDPLTGGNSKLERIECIDNVVITRKNTGEKAQWGTCGKAVYYHKEGSITMTIEPILYQDDSKITGTRLTFFTNKKEIEGSDVRITARNVGTKEEGPDKKDKEEKKDKKKKEKSDADVVDGFYADDQKKAPQDEKKKTDGRVKRKLSQKEADAILGLDGVKEKDK